MKILHWFFPNLRPSVQGALSTLERAITALQRAAHHHEAEADRHADLLVSLKAAHMVHLGELARAQGVAQKLRDLVA